MKTGFLASILVLIAGLLMASCDDYRIVASCENKVKDGDETGVDCGGPCPTKCAEDEGCAIAQDCVSHVCVSNACAPASCKDNVMNGDETGVDCGGSCATQCAENGPCLVGSDCQTGVCKAGVCQAPGCHNNVMNGNETDVDCGGPCAKKCAVDLHCVLSSDCVSEVCTKSVCTTACDDSHQNGTETDVDCGGSCPMPCAIGKHCSMGGDCISHVCTSGACTANCADNVQNENETGVDCGGPCVAAPDFKTCAFAVGCGMDADCTGGKCGNDHLCAATCTDNVQNGDESDVDCGQACGPMMLCPQTQKCMSVFDCESSVCTAGVCQAPGCGDHVQNGDETDTDCGGLSCPGTCGYGKVCTKDGDCIGADALCGADGHCAASCTDGEKNGLETDKDCGGLLCPRCADTLTCVSQSDCLSDVCTATECKPANCGDGVMNGGETDIDCGGPCVMAFPKCGPGKGCMANTDCLGGSCSLPAHTCAPTCTDKAKNGDETDVDCGGSCATQCPNGKGCKKDDDCASGRCNGAMTCGPWSTGFGGPGATAVATAVAVDSAGNIVVAGYFKGTVFFGGTPYSSDKSGNFDMFVAQYDRFGKPGWLRQFGSQSDDIPSGIAVDGQNNILVTGEAGSIDFGNGPLTSFGVTDVVVFKLKPTSEVLWARLLGGALQDVGNGIAVDGQDNVIVVGISNASVSADFGPLCMLPSANTGDDVFVAKFDSLGKCLWAQRTGGTSIDTAYGVAVDGPGNIFLTGYYYNDGPDFGFLTKCPKLPTLGSAGMFAAGLSSDGNTCLWAIGFGDNSATYGQGVSIDNSGGVFVAGAYGSNATTSLVCGGSGPLPHFNGKGAFVANFDAMGDCTWIKGFDALQGNAAAAGIATSGSDVVFAANFDTLGMNGPDFGNGTPVQAFGQSDVAVAKLSGNNFGNCLYSASFGSPGADLAGADFNTIGPSSPITVNPLTRNVVMVGSFQQTIDFGAGQLISVGGVGGSDVFIVSLGPL